VTRLEPGWCGRCGRFLHGRRGAGFAGFCRDCGVTLCRDCERPGYEWSTVSNRGEVRGIRCRDCYEVSVQEQLAEVAKMLRDAGIEFVDCQTGDVAELIAAEEAARRDEVDAACDSIMESLDRDEDRAPGGVTPSRAEPSPPWWKRYIRRFKSMLPWAG